MVALTSGPITPHRCQNISVPRMLCTPTVLFDEGGCQGGLIHRWSHYGPQLVDEHRLPHRDAAGVHHQLLRLHFPKASWNPQKLFDRAGGRGKHTAEVTSASLPFGIDFLALFLCLQIHTPFTTRTLPHLNSRRTQPTCTQTHTAH